MTDTNPPGDQAERRARYAAAIRPAGDSAYGHKPFYEAITTAAIAVADAEQTELRVRVRELESSCRDVDRLRKDWVEMRDRAEELDERVKALAAATVPASAPTDPSGVAKHVTRSIFALKTPSPDGSKHYQSGWDDGLEAAMDAARDALLAVLPAPTDQSAVLREAAEKYERLLDDMGEDKAKDPRYWQGVQHVTVGLRRLADAASGPGRADDKPQQDEAQAEAEPRHTCLDQTTAPGRDWECQYCSTLPESITVTPAAVSQPGKERTS